MIEWIPEPSLLGATSSNGQSVGKAAVTAGVAVVIAAAAAFLGFFVGVNLEAAYPGEIACSKCDERRD